MRFLPDDRFVSRLMKKTQRTTFSYLLTTNAAKSENKINNSNLSGGLFEFVLQKFLDEK